MLPLHSCLSSALWTSLWSWDWDVSPQQEGCRSRVVRDCQCQSPCSNTSADLMRVTSLGVRQQDWKYKLGNQVKPLLSCRTPAHTLLSCSLECTTWEAFADCGVHLVIFFHLLKLQTQWVKIACPCHCSKNLGDVRTHCAHESPTLSTLWKYSPGLWCTGLYYFSNILNHSQVVFRLTCWSFMLKIVQVTSSECVVQMFI